MPGRLEGKIVLITGTAGTQGRAAALLFAREGAVVVGGDLDVGGAEETLRLVKESGGEMVSMQPLDLAEGEQVRAWVSWAAQLFGGIDVLYNNASAPKFNPIDEMSWDEWTFTLRNELDLVYWTCHLAWPHLVARGGGAIINTASTAGLIGIAHLGNVAHSATKGGVIALTRQLAAEGAAHGIRANSISPGFVPRAPVTETPVTTDSYPARMTAAQMIKRPGRPEEIAYCALYLASEVEAGFVTGANIVVDGGLTAW